MPRRRDTRLPAVGAETNASMLDAPTASGMDAFVSEEGVAGMAQAGCAAAEEKAPARPAARKVAAAVSAADLAAASTLSLPKGRLSVTIVEARNLAIDSSGEAIVKLKKGMFSLSLPLRVSPSLSDSFSASL